MGSMWTSLIAVGGTLAGVSLTGLWTVLSGRMQRREGRRTEIVKAVADVAAAFADHRTAMFVREEARLTSTAAARVGELRDASHATRAAVTAPLVTLLVLAPALTEAARAAEAATYAMRGAADLERLGEKRTEALAAADALVRTAGQYVADRDTH